MDSKPLKTYCTLHDDCLDSPELAEACASERGAVIRVEKSIGSKVRTVVIENKRYEIVRSTRDRYGIDYNRVQQQISTQGVWYPDRWYLVLPEGGKYDFYGPLGGSTMLEAIDYLARWLEHGVSTSYPSYPTYPPEYHSRDYDKASAELRKLGYTPLKENPVSSSPFVRALGAVVAGVAVAYTAFELKDVKNW